MLSASAQQALYHSMPGKQADTHLRGLALSAASLAGLPRLRTAMSLEAVPFACNGETLMRK